MWRCLDTSEVEQLGHLCSVALALKVLPVSPMYVPLHFSPPPPINLTYNPTDFLLPESILRGTEQLPRGVPGFEVSLHSMYPEQKKTEFLEVPFYVQQPIRGFQVLSFTVLALSLLVFTFSLGKGGGAARFLVQGH